MAEAQKAWIKGFTARCSCSATEVNVPPPLLTAGSTAPPTPADSRSDATHDASSVNQASCCASAESRQALSHVILRAALRASRRRPRDRTRRHPKHRPNRRPTRRPTRRARRRGNVTTLFHQFLAEKSSSRLALRTSALESMFLWLAKTTREFQWKYPSPCTPEKNDVLVSRN